LTSINQGEFNTKESVNCVRCDKKEFEYLGAEEISQKEISGKIPELFHASYRKNTFRMILKCKNCNKIALYPMDEA